MLGQTDIWASWTAAWGGARECPGYPRSQVCRRTEGPPLPSPGHPERQRTPRYLRVITSRRGISRHMEIWGGKARACRLCWCGDIASVRQPSRGAAWSRSQLLAGPARAACRPAAPRPAQIAQEHAGPAVQPGRARGLEETLRHCQPSARTVLPLDALGRPQVRRPQCPPCRTLHLAVPD